MRTGLVAALALAAALAGAGLAGAHAVNYVSADAQVTPDGTVVVEGAFVERSGWVAVHERTADGEAGEALGATRLPRANRFYTDVGVPIDDAAWRDWTAREVVVVLYGEDGDGEFTDADPPLSGFGVVVTDDATVAEGPRAVVTGEGDFPQRTGTPEVTVRRAVLPADGHLVVRNRTTDGRVVGVRSLDAGTHENVTVAVNRSFYDARDGEFVARAMLYRDDGDGRFAAADAPVRADNETVTTAFRVERGQQGGLVTTPVPTTAPAPTTGNATDPDASPDTTATGGQPGFGPAAALLALAVGALLALAGGRRTGSG
jgi:hypothetical protein